MARSASPRVVAGIVHHTEGGKQGRDEKGERRSDPPGIETEVHSLDYVSVDFLKEGDVILIQKEKQGGAAKPPSPVSLNLKKRWGRKWPRLHFFILVALQV
jgi:hypothetical protein